MKKKKILVLFSLLIASLPLFSCDDEESIVKQNDTQIIDSTKKNRGTEDSTDYDIKLPEELINSGSDIKEDIPDEPIIDENAVEIGDDVEEKTLDDNTKLLSVENRIGYKFLGWFKDDKLISTNETIKVDVSDDIVPKFVILDEFKGFQFTSTSDECVLTKFKDLSVYEFVIPEGITKISSYAFEGSKVVILTLPKSLKEINSYAFANSNIYNIKFQNIPSVIGASLANNSKLLQVDLPSEDINTSIFNNKWDSSNLIYPDYVYEDIDNFIIHEDYLFNSFQYNGETGWYLIAYLGNDTDLVLPNSFDKIPEYEIGSHAFSLNENIKSVEIPSNVIGIGYEAFYGCRNLSKIIIGKDVKAIDYDAFYGCESLYNVYNLSSLILEINSDEYGYVAYYAYLVENDLTIDSPVKSITDFDYVENEGVITILKYKGNDKIVTIPKFEDKQIILGDKLFAKNQRIDEVILNENVVEIGEETFSETSIKKFDSLNVESIGTYAFAESSIRYLSLPNVKFIPDYLCYRCKNLKELFIPKAETISQCAFLSCDCLYTVELPSTLTSIEYNAFYYCNNLIEVVNNSALSISKSSGNGYVGYYAKNIISDKADSKLKVYDGLVVYEDSDNILVAVLKDFKKLTIPESVSLINQCVLRGLELEEIYINFMNFNSLNVYFGGDSYSGDSIPSTLKKVTFGDNVTTIKGNAFFETNIEEIEFGKNCTYIGECAFENTNIKKVYFNGSIDDWCQIEFQGETSNPLCSGNAKLFVKDNDEYVEINKLIIPDTVSTISNYQFTGFSGEEVVLPDNLSVIESYAFKNCKNLTSINFPNGLSEIGESAFENNSLEKIVLPDSLTTVYYAAFKNSLKVKSVTIPSGIVTIGSNLFENCQLLMSVVFEEGIAEIGYEAFKNCKSLFNISLPTTLNSIGDNAFMGCENLDDVDLSKTDITILNEGVFADCSRLVNIIFSDDLESIDATTFKGCNKLSYLIYKNGCYFGTKDNPYRWLVKGRTKTILECIVHNDCEKIFNNAFTNCTNLRKLVISPNCSDFTGCLGELTNIEYVEYPIISTASFGNELFGVSNSNIPSKVKTIVINSSSSTLPSSVFNGLTSVESISINSTIEEIGSSAFLGCSSLVNLELGNDLLKINDNAFKNCSKLDLQIPSTVTTIGNYAFESTAITSYIASSSITKLGTGAFKNCKMLEEANLSAYVYNTSSPMGGYVFSGCSALSNVQLPTGINTLQNYTFENCTSLTSIDFPVSYPTSLTRIEEGVFKNSGLSEITWNKVNYIGKYSFEGTKIETVLIPADITGIALSAFKNCKKLKTVSLEIQNVREGMFEGCSNLETVYTNTSTKITEINASAFKDCTSLTSIDLSKITEIKNNAFENSGLTSLNIATAVKLGTEAFKNCDKLETVELTNSDLSYKLTGNSNDSYGIFEECDILSSVTIPVSSVVVNMFKGCVSLNTFDFSNITTIYNSAFENTGFTTLTLPATITNVNSSAFANCKSLTSIKVNCKLYTSTYKELIFANCTSLVNVELSSDNTIIPTSTFLGCSSLSTFDFSNIIEIDYRAFYGCGFEEIIIPATVTTFGTNTYSDCQAFSQNAKLKKATLSSNGTAYGLFSGCNNLEELIVGEGVTKIYDGLCDDCKSLTKVTLPQTLTSIGEYAFRNTVLKSITIPQNVEEISLNANNSLKSFYNCTKLVEVYNLSSLNITAGSDDNGNVAKYAKVVHNSSEDESSIVTSGDYTFIVGDNVTYLVSYNGNDKNLILPSSIEYGSDTITSYKIIDYAFYENRDIESVTIPDGVTSIGSYAFCLCTGLRNVNISENSNLTLIDERAFDSCNSINCFVVPSKVTTVGAYAFVGCYRLVEIYNLSNLNIVKADTTNGYISEFALIVHNSMTDKSILVEENNYLFASTNNLGYIIQYFGESSEITIPSTFTYYENIINVSIINKYAFHNNTVISNVTINENINKIDSYAFQNCNIDKLVVLAKQINMGERPFYGCKIKEATIPNSLLRYINYYGNYSAVNTELIKVRLLDGSYIDLYSFYNCEKLEIIIIPVTIKSVYDSFFKVNNTLKIFYEGTKEEFENIYNNYSSSAFSYGTKYFYSEEAPADTENNYWHYVNGEIVIWTTE